MKKTLLILSFILISVVSFAQRQRTTAVFDSDTTTRPKAGFYGIGVRSNNIYFVPPTGNNIRLANYSLFTGLTTNYLTKWNGSKFINSNIYEDGTFFSSNAPNFLIGGSFPLVKLNGSQSGSIVYDLRSYIGGVSNGGFEIYDNTNSASRLVISGGGNVGIGTASPSAKLTVAGNIELPFGADRFISIGSSSNYSYSISSFGDDFRILEAGSTPRFVIKYPNGNIGIGTTNPTSKIQVVGIPVYADNTTATSAGLTVGAFYRTALGVLMVVY